MAGPGVKVVLEDARAITVDGLEIPLEVQSLDGFRSWLAGLGPSAPRASFCAGRVHIEMTPQSYDDHEPLVRAVNVTLEGLSRSLDLGRYFFPPSWITCEEVGLSTEPDGFLVTWARLESGAFRINPARRSEALGAPTMVFEAVSARSVQKDLVELAELYAAAGVEEYWIADARRKKLDFRILVRGRRGFTTQPASRGWIASRVWGRSFRLLRAKDRAGLPGFALESRG
jgi:Uma2 family endonuclease